jgi:hypothetical protein
MSAISPLGFNNKLEFIIMAKKGEICQLRSNFELSNEIKTSTFLRTLAMISRVSYTSIQAQELVDGLHKLIMSLFWRVLSCRIGIQIRYFCRIITTAIAPMATPIINANRLNDDWASNGKPTLQNRLISTQVRRFGGL